jgi:hypothetical protein
MDSRLTALSRLLDVWLILLARWLAGYLAGLADCLAGSAS